MHYDDIKAQALKLPRDERAKLALLLLNSLKQAPPSGSDGTIEQAWIDESVKRLEAYCRGEMAAFSADEVIAELESLNVDQGQQEYNIP